VIPVEVDQPVVEVETDKAVVEVPSRSDGLVEELLVDEGEMVPVGDVILSLRVDEREETPTNDNVDADGMNVKSAASDVDVTDGNNSDDAVVVNCKPPVPSLSAVKSPPRREMLSSGELRISEQIGAGGQAVIHKATLPDSQHPPEQIAIREPNPRGTLTRGVLEAFHTQSATWKTIDAREREKQRWADSEHIVGVDSSW